MAGYFVNSCSGSGISGDVALKFGLTTPSTSSHQHNVEPVQFYLNIEVPLREVGLTPQLLGGLDADLGMVCSMLLVDCHISIPRIQRRVVLHLASLPVQSTKQATCNL